MNLVVDIGNSSGKAAIFNKDEIISTKQWEISDIPEVLEWMGPFPKIENSIISTVKKDDGGLKGEFELRGIRVLVLDEQTPLPLLNHYKTPATLGKDRLAAAVGANAKFPDQNLLIIDAGTAITIDFVSSGNEYMGGNISPGLSMRFRSLAEYTDNLPLLEKADEEVLLGDNTEAAIRAGIQWGIIFELDEYINRQKNRYPDLQVILTGGDSLFFDKKLKNSIFVDLNLNLLGLHRILDHNVVA
jgi:type III pantothenate kinase